MRAIVLERKESQTVKEIEKPHAAFNEVIVKVKAAGLCGSDAHIYHGTYPAKYPLVQGHEFAGEIVEIGEKVTGWKVGQRVTADPNIYCHHCYYCLKDQENMCENAEAIGVTRNGAFSEYVAVPVSQLYELPDTMSYEEGALIEPLACVLYGVKRLAMPYGSKVVIYGAGPMGLLLLKALKTGGASELVMVDIDQKRLEVAEKMGATHTCTSVEAAKEMFTRGFDVVVDATGNPGVIQEMFGTAAKRAKILQFGCADTKASCTISPYQIYDNDWEYIGTRTAVFTFSQAIDIVASGRIEVKDVISEVTDMPTMAEYLEKGKPAGTLIIILKP